MAISAFVWAVIATVASTAISVAMAIKQKKAMEDAQSGILIQKQGGTHPIPVIYGERRVAPVKVWEDISKQRFPITSVASVADSGFTHNNEFDYKSSRDDEDFLHRIDVWCRGPIESIGGYEIDNDGMSHKRFTQAKHNRPLFRSLNKHGSESQSMFSSLAGGFSGITSDMKGNGLAWSWNSFFYTQDRVAYYGDPQLTALIKGLKLWDPRDNPNDPTVKVWSNNPALILLDYLTAEHGKGLSISDVDLSSIITAADACDVVVALPDQVGILDGRFVYNPVSGEYIYIPAGNANPNGNAVGSQKRFTCNVVLQPDVDSKDNVAEILKTFKGSLPFINGQYVLSMEVAASSVMSFDNDNIIDGVTISYADRSNRFNQVTVKFPNALKGYKEDAVAWPKSSSDMYTTLVNEDSGEKLTTETKLSGVTSYSQAEDLAEFMVRDSRNQQIITFKTQPLAMQLEPNDIITVTTDSLNYTAQPYRVREVKLGTDLTVQIVAQEYDPTVYPWYDGDPEPAPEYLPSSIFDVPNAVEGLLLSSNSGVNTDGTASNSIDVAWDEIETGTSTVDKLEVGHKLAAGTNYSWAVIPSGSENAYNIVGITDGQTYDVVIRYRNMVGQYSPDTTSSIAIGAVSTVVNTLSNVSAQTAIDLEEIILEAETQEDTLNEISETLLDLALTTGATLGKINDAGIVVNPDDGTVIISAVESLRDETSVTSTNLGIRLDAAEGEIVLKASQSFVNDAIAAATLPEATLDSLTDLQLQVTNVGIDLNAAEGSLLLKADTTTVDGLQVSYDQTVIDVDALENAITLKTDSADFDAISTRVNTAEVVLESLDAPSIALTVRSVRGIHEELDLADEARLADLLLAYNDREAITTDIAVATIELHAEVNDRREAVASARTELGSLIDNNLATLVSEQVTRASETSALASDITTLTATVGEDRASVNSYQDATVDALDLLNAKQGVALDVNGYITGYEQFNDGTTSGFTISSDSFKVIDPDGGANQSGVQVFSIENNIVSLGDGVELSADRITAGVLDADRITLNGRDITELTNDANYQTDGDVAITIGTAQTAAEDYADAAVSALDFTPYLVSSDVTAFITQAEADAAQAAAESYADQTVGLIDFSPYLISSDISDFITQASADLLVANLQSAEDVASALAADTTVIDGSRITTGTIDAGRISISGLDISDLNNDEGYALDSDIPDVSLFQTAANVSAALASDTTVIDGSRITTGTIDAARISISGLNISDLTNDEGYALDTDIPDVSLFQTAANVSAALASDTTVIDGSRITTGTIDAARISISGLDISDLNNDSSFATTSAVATAVSNIDLSVYALESDLSGYITTVQGTAIESSAESYADSLVVGLQTAADVSAALASDTTVIDGSRITTGTIDAGRISISGLDISDLNNDEGYALDSDIPDVSGLATSAELTSAEAAAESYADALVVGLQTAADVSAALASDTTVIDGSRITTGTIDAARISISGLNISDLTNDEGYALDTAIPDVSSFQTAAEVAAAIATDTTVIDGARITTGVINADLITAGTIRAERLSIDGNFLTVDSNGVLQIAQGFVDSTVAQPTGVDDTTGNTDPSVTVTRIAGGKVSLGVSWSLNKAAGVFTVSNPFPVVVQLKRDGAVLTSWTVTTGLGGFYEGGVSGSEPSFAVGSLNTIYLDNSGTTGTATYSVSVTALSTSNFNLATQLTAQAIV